MMIEMTAVGERDIAVRLEAMPAKLHRRLVATITQLTERLLAAVIAGEPSRSGRLRAATRMRVDQTEDAVRGRVFVAAGSRSEFGKAAALEYGAHGSVKVSGHLRSGHTPFGAPAQQMVAAYTRQANILARRFERSALDAMRSEIIAGLKEATEGL